MIAYLDSSVIARAFLPDERGHREAADLLERSDLVRLTGSWSRVEVTSALVRAARAGRRRPADVIALADSEFGESGRVAVVTFDRDEMERDAVDIVTAHELRAMDAWHLAVARRVQLELAEPDESFGFASRDEAQAAVATRMGFVTL